MLYYLSSVRLPARKAHAIQQVKMCQGFADAGSAVSLVTRRNPAGVTSWADIADYYGLTTPFDLEVLPTPAADRQIPIPGVPNLDHLLTTAWLLYRSRQDRFGPEDIIYSRDPYPTWFFLEAIARLPRTSTPTVWFEQHQIDRGLGPAFYDRLDGLVCISDRQRRAMRQRHPVLPSRIGVEHDGVDLRPYLDRSRSTARERIGIDPDERVVVYTGNLYPSKDVESLIEAAHHIDASVLVVGGEPEDISRIASDQTIPDSVTFTGHVPPADVPDYQLAADVLVLTVAVSPELDYFSPLKLFEYLASGNPTVVARKPEYEEVVEDGVSCRFYTPESVRSLVSSISALLADPELGEELGRNGRSVAAEHTWERRAQRILDRIG